ncbi:hypothetical protein B0H14DRAFT_3466428 [Mycena olivaceomarginata]|nr:hypothetical protein B0H14DRAFT_3466428 [Mycena olivaceomarginata]
MTDPQSLSETSSEQASLCCLNLATVPIIFFSLFFWGRAQIKEAVLETMRMFDVDPLSLLPVEQTPTFEPFMLECIEEAYTRGYLSRSSDLALTEKHVRIGAAVDHYAYFHHRGTSSHKITVLGSLCIALDFCIDDNCFDPHSIEEYGSRLVAGRPQLEKGLDDYRAVTSELSDMYDATAGDLMRMSSLAYVAGVHLEAGMCGGGASSWDVSTDAPHFPNAMKAMASDSIAMTVQTFPHAVPSRCYLQALPDAAAVHEHMADILSYYKEALAGEFNRVEQIAQLRGIEGSDMLSELVSSMAVRN